MDLEPQLILSPHMATSLSLKQPHIFLKLAATEKCFQLENGQN